MALPIDSDFYIDRASLSEVFKDPRTLMAFETALQVVQATPEGIDQAQQAAEGAQTAADDAAAAAAAADAAAAAAQGGVLALNAAPYVTFGASATLSNERVVTAANGVSFDTLTAGQIKILVDALAILNALTSIDFTKPVDVQAALRCDSLRIDASPAASATAASHALPINLNGTTYYLKLSATP